MEKDGRIVSVTNSLGEFMVHSQTGDTLVVSHIGYDSKQVIVTHNDSVPVLKNHQIELKEQYTMLPNIDILQAEYINEGYSVSSEVPDVYYEETVPLIQYIAKYSSYTKASFDPRENFVYYDQYPQSVRLDKFVLNVIKHDKSLNKGSFRHFKKTYPDLQDRYSQRPSMTISTTFSSGSSK